MTATIEARPGSRPAARRPQAQTPEPGAWSSLAYGAGILAFLLAPMLIPGTSFQTSVLESSGLAFAGYLGLCLWAILDGLRTSVRRGRRTRRSTATA